MASIFSKIVSGEIPCYHIAETKDFLAFLDVRPVTKGHTLVIPKQEIDNFFDLDDQQMREIMVFAKKVAKAIEKIVPCNRVGVSVIGLEVPHAHVHLLPINSLSDMDFTKVRPTFSEDDMQNMAAEISACFTDVSYDEDYQNYIALLLIYLGNTSIGLSDAEMNYIKTAVGEVHFNEAKSEFDQLSEVEVIERIDELSNEFSRENKGQVLDDVCKIIAVDQVEETAQANIIRMLKKLI